MTSRERVLKTFNFEPVDCIPRWCGMSDEFYHKAMRQLNLDDQGLRIRFGDDFRRVYSRYQGPKPILQGNATWESPFGVQRHGIGYGHPTSHPLKDISSMDEAVNYPWPDSNWVDASNIRKDALQWDGTYAILGGEWSPLWHDVIDLVGHENLYYLMYDHPDITSYLFQRVTDYYWEASKKTFEAAEGEIDIFFIGNDLGGQQGPLIGPDLFSTFVLPQLKRLIDLGHSFGLKVMMHCCGSIRPLIPLLIDSGLDALHALQPDTRDMDGASLKQEFGGRIVLNGGIDSHHILIEGKSPEYVREKTLEVLSALAPGGGYIAGASHDTILEETPVENVLAMFDAVAEYSAANFPH